MGAETKITPAALKAGAAVIRLYNPDFYSAEEIAKDAWEAMAVAMEQCSEHLDEPQAPNAG